MRLLSLFTFATIAFSVVSALPLSKSNGIVARDDLNLVSSREFEVLEARARGVKNRSSRKFVPPPPDKVTFAKGEGAAHNGPDTLDKLGLHGKSRKSVEDFHRKAVEEHMAKIPGAHSAVIKQLAHTKGSRDPNIHISAEIRDIRGNIITAPRRGNPDVMDPTHHIYANSKDPTQGYHSLPIKYRKAVDRLHNVEGQPTGEGTI